jgi:hypothetical protein
MVEAQAYAAPNARPMMPRTQKGHHAVQHHFREARVARHFQEEHEKRRKEARAEQLHSA